MGALSGFASPEARQTQAYWLALASMDAADAALGTLISGRQRKDGKDWKTAYEYMQVYLQVGGLALWLAVLVAHPLPARLLSSCGMRSAWTSMTGWTS